VGAGRASPAGVRPRKIRPGLDELKRQFGAEYLLMAPELETDGVDLLWDFSRTKADEGLIEARSGQHVIRKIVADYLAYLTLGADNLPESLKLQAAMPSEVVVSPRHCSANRFSSRVVHAWPTSPT
jgi:hypothetical protein